MHQAALLLEPCTGRREGRGHDGKVMVMRSNLRWCSDGLEFACWNGEIIRMAFIIDAFDREIIAWTALSGAGISGSGVRDMMLEAVDKRFGSARAPQPIEPQSDNGSPYTAKETRDFATALNLVPCFTPVPKRLGLWPQNPDGTGAQLIFEAMEGSRGRKVCSAALPLFPQSHFSSTEPTTDSMTLVAMANSACRISM